MRKGEIACYKQFLLFSQCFPLLNCFSASKCGIGLRECKTYLKESCLEFNKMQTGWNLEHYSEFVIYLNWDHKTSVYEDYQQLVTSHFLENLISPSPTFFRSRFICRKQIKLSYRHVEKRYEGKSVCISFFFCKSNEFIFNPLHTIPRFNPFPNKPWFLCVCTTSLLKTL